MMTETTTTDPIYSEFGGDPDLGELVEMFVDEMVDRVASLRQAYDQDDMRTLRTLAHQLKGAAGSYGFPQLTTSAYTLEAAVREKASAEEIEVALNALIDLCRRTRSGVA